jgi:type VI protein secretion system component VasA
MAVNSLSHVALSVQAQMHLRVLYCSHLPLAFATHGRSASRLFAILVATAAQRVKSRHSAPHGAPTKLPEGAN